MTPVDDHDPVGGLLGLAEVVGGHEHGHPVGREVAHHLADQLAPRHVDARGRLVEERDLRPTDEREGEGEALLFTPGELAPHRGAALCEPDAGQQFVRVGRLREEGGVEAQDLDRTDARVDAAFLQHDADRRGEGVVVGVRVEPRDAHGAGRGPPEALEGLHGRGLAGAVGAEQRHDLAVLDRERDPVDGGELAVTDDELVDVDGTHVRRR